MIGTWVQWKPTNWLEKKYNIDEVIDNSTGFAVILSARNAKNERVTIHFKESVEAYHSANETLRCRLISDLDSKYGTDFYGNWTLFTVTNSPYLKWISEQSCTISDNMELVHFSILAANMVLDIAAISKPIIWKA